MKKLMAVLFLGLTLGLNVVQAVASESQDEFGPTVSYPEDQY